jgi:hypothetical protein
MRELQAVIKVCPVTLGGLKRLVLVDPNDLISQPSWYDVPNIADLSFKPGKAAYDFRQDRFSGRLVGTPNAQSNAGDIHEYKLDASVRGISADMELFLSKLRNRRIHVIGTYLNDQQRFVPYMRLIGGHDSGDRPGSRMGYIFSGVARLDGPAPIVNGTIDIITGPYVPPDTTPPTGGSGASTVTLTTTGASYTYTIPAGKWLVGWELTGSAAQTVALGTTSGGMELGGPVDLLATQTWVGQGNSLSTSGSHPIYFSGLTGTNTIKLWLLG